MFQDQNTGESPINRTFFRTVYILPGAPSEALAWKASIERIAFTNTNCLSEQQEKKLQTILKD